MLELQPPPRLDGVIGTDGPIVGGALAGLVGIDGSCLSPTFSHASRAGWSCVKIDAHGNSEGAIFGPLPCALQEIGAAELWAFYMCLCNSAGALVVITDHKNLVDGVAAGPEACCRPAKIYSEIWSKTWFKLNEIGRDQVELHWIHSHASWREAQARWVPWLHFRANKLADDFAKRGANMHPVSDEVEEQRPLLWWSSYFVSLYTGRILGHLAAASFPDALKPRLRRVFDPLELVSDPKGHQVKWRGGRWCCLACGRNCKTRARLVQGRCPGVPAKLAQAHWSHRLWWSGGLDGLVWCSACGAYARKQILALADPCLEHPTGGRARAFKELKRGMDPTSKQAIPRSSPVVPPLHPRRVGWVKGLYEVMAECRDVCLEDPE